MKYFLLTILAGASVGCSTGHSMGDKEDAWFVNQVSVLGFNKSEVYYCKSNKTERGAAPQCFEAEMKNIKVQ